MLDLLNPYCENVSKMSATEFEKYCYRILKQYAERENLNNFIIEHNKKINAYDGEYQIDIYAEFTALNMKIKILCECKKLDRPVERKVVAELAQKLQSCKLNKGVIISTSGFQSGAAKFAEEHGIALIQILEKSIIFIHDSFYCDKKRIMNKYHMATDYYGMLCDDYGFPIKQIYP